MSKIKNPMDKFNNRLNTHKDRLGELEDIRRN